MVGTVKKMRNIIWGAVLGFFYLFILCFFKLLHVASVFLVIILVGRVGFDYI